MGGYDPLESDVGKNFKLNKRINNAKSKNKR
jgi:hypothetical protein